VSEWEQAVAILRDSRWTIALTGAGISVESGIPDFRSPGGLWDRFNPMEYAHIDAFRRNPAKVWEMLREMSAVVREARPNAAHVALAELEQLGVLKTIVTQNIDDLHQQAGSRRVIEFHGNSRRMQCLYCHREYEADEAERRVAETGVFPPRCPIDDHILKPTVVFFGEAIPAQAAAEAYDEARNCQAILVVGTSATVFPASSLPMIARERGARVIEINTAPTGLTYQVAHLSLFGSAGEILPELVRRLKPPA
jgi:NAD-dependent deacetylase